MLLFSTKLQCQQEGTKEKTGSAVLRCPAPVWSKIPYTNKLAGQRTYLDSQIHWGQPMYSSVRCLETVNQGQNSQLFLQDLHTPPDLYQDG